MDEKPCPKCGYMMGPFDAECAKCARGPAAAPGGPAVTVQPERRDGGAEAGKAKSWVGPGPVNEPPELPRRLRGFNLGAFAFTWLWALCHRSYVIAVLILLVGGLSFLGPLRLLLLAPMIVLSLLMGVYGNRIAWHNRRFESEEDFLRVHRAWQRAAIVVLAIFVLNTIQFVIRAYLLFPPH